MGTPDRMVDARRHVSEKAARPESANASGKAWLVPGRTCSPERPGAILYRRNRTRRKGFANEYPGEASENLSYFPRSAFQKIAGLFPFGRAAVAARWNLAGKTKVVWQLAAPDCERALLGECIAEKFHPADVLPIHRRFGAMPRRQRLREPVRPAILRHQHQIGDGLLDFRPGDLRIAGQRLGKNHGTRSAR